ncbi:hypothetical protein FH972_026670 [Carpinus fangiana]|uniref:RING-type domain-containing protein n=1 Tax=Carpinus fangiana TaxID=176857 RepID=A0A5N6L4N8_9ROSI|nr:hypothetical protein FH972_026670 [Carpinus fangiana]
MASHYKSRPLRHVSDSNGDHTPHRRVTSSHVNFSASSTRPASPDAPTVYSSSRHTPAAVAALSTHSSRPDTAQPSRSTSRAQRASPSFTAPRSKRGMTGMLDIDRPHTRRDRTFVGAECAACEEPLEHTLRGEKVLQLSCGHVSHEACFYEYIREFEALSCPVCEAPLGLDTSRGGNVLDLEKLSSAYRAQTLRDDYRSHRTAPSQATSQYTSNHDSRAGHYQPSVSDRRRRHTKISSRNSRGAHGRNASDGTRSTVGPASTIDQSIMSGRPDMDHNTPTTSPRLQPISNPIPPPSILIRSEYPTLHRSKQQQSLTCLVTVEMPEGKWKPSVEDLRRLAEQTRQQEDREAPRKLPHKRGESRMSEVPEVPEELPPELQEELDRLTENLIARVDNWHGLDFLRFGRLRLHDTLLVGKDRQSWQELECYLFGEMLICVKEKKVPQSQAWDGQELRKFTLKGSIMIKKHLANIEQTLGDDEDDNVLTLSLSVPELPAFHLQFPSLEKLDQWRESLFSLGGPDEGGRDDYSDDGTILSTEYDDNGPRVGALSSIHSSYGANKSYNTAPTEYSEPRPLAHRKQNLSYSLHVPIDIVVVVPLSSHMHGLKISLLKDLLKFLLYSLGRRDRLGLVGFGAGGGAIPLANLTSNDWPSWDRVVESIKATGPKSARIDPVEGANVAMDILMQRKTSNPISSILIVSDSSTAEEDSVDFVVSRAEAARVSIYTFGLGLNHKPDALIVLSQRTKAAYLYVKDWMLLRECVAGVLGSLQSVCHQNVLLKLRLPDGSPGKFVKVSGALMSSTRATGREAEASLGDLRFGEKRDVLVQLAVAPESSHDQMMAQDPWETIVSDLEALGGSLDADFESRHNSIDEVPMLQANLSYGDILRDGAITQTPRPSLLTITVLPTAPPRPSSKSHLNSRPPSPPIPPHPSVVQRRMELLTSDMMTRALTLVSRGQNDRAHHLLQETRSILKGLGKGGLPPLPPPSAAGSAEHGKKQPTPLSATQTASSSRNPSPNTSTADLHSPPPHGALPAPPSPSTTHMSLPPPPPPPLTPANIPLSPAPGIDFATMVALDAELAGALEWLAHPAVFARDARKAVLQAIGTASNHGRLARAVARRARHGLWPRARRRRQEGHQGQGRRLLLPDRHLADRNQGHRPAAQRQGDARLHQGRGGAA